ncbi:hypothetical protein TrispH2_001641 [Trichoplax sp. H2]|uniref:Uncharacterized protein n=1 Tax=Trichoplax adhaerens TaxID=10228 RepID=B3RVR6_TRIAD|nr:hypothetical protein TRIADDRAFT_55749 [Trichoplax adhaerens]EDV26042.1 hypothetical protein TRIADDRAFT_55749 [Trichoplax adhaerens]RDD47022.1 hypothetical protein TrispH2_001641 [Trichoplax sp. H2]|eukprot:XP_002112075.1 hypothetical protein TRIADDRAFT_55749 [Trichoplax adhaerens]
MVLTFGREPLLHQRYKNLEIINVEELPEIVSKYRKDPPKEKKSKEEEIHDFPNFIRDQQQERKGGPLGYLDSERYIKTIKKKIVHHDVNYPKRAKDVVSLSQQMTDHEQQFGQHMKAIEDHMWKHKQEERELKRAEGDIIKSQQTLRRTMRVIEKSISKKDRAEEQMIRENDERIVSTKRQHDRLKIEDTKFSINDRINFSQKIKDAGRKHTLVSNELKRKYEAVAAKLALKEQELEHLSSDFQQKFKHNEEEQFKLKQELADLSLSTNMELQASRKKILEDQEVHKQLISSKLRDSLDKDVEVEKNLNTMESVSNQYYFNKRRFSNELRNAKESLSEKSRDEGRAMTDIRTNLQRNSQAQRRAQENAEYLVREAKRQQMIDKVEQVEARRNAVLEMQIRGKKQRSQVKLDDWQKRLKERNYNSTRRRHEDAVKQLKRIVTKEEAAEYNLYTKVREHGSMYRKQEQIQNKLMKDLILLKEDNEAKLRRAAAAMRKMELELEHQIRKQASERDKHFHARNESQKLLHHHRLRAEEDKHLLVEEEREHNRLQRIGTKSEDYTVLQPI